MPGLLSQSSPKSTAKRLARLGRHGDTLLAHITPQEARLLDRTTDGGSINPTTGLLEFFDPGDESWGGDTTQGGSLSSDNFGDNEGGERKQDKSVGDTIGDYITEKVQAVKEHPVATATNLAFGAVPVVGLANTFSGMLGGPTVGDLVEGAYQSAKSPSTAGNRGGLDMGDNSLMAPGVTNMSGSGYDDTQNGQVLPVVKPRQGLLQDVAADVPTSSAPTVIAPDVSQNSAAYREGYEAAKAGAAAENPYPEGDPRRAQYEAGVRLGQRYV